MPSGMTSKHTCHCRACCSCAPSEILQGLCPAHARLSTSTTSLDTGLSNLEGMETVPCVFEHNPQKSQDSEQQHSNQVQNTYQPPVVEPVSVKTHPVSPPKYYSQSLQRKCKICGEVIRQSPLPIGTGDRHAELPGLPLQASFCRCKQHCVVLSRPSAVRSEVTAEDACPPPPAPLPQSSKAVHLNRDKVEPLQFKSRLDVSCCSCTLLT